MAEQKSLEQFCSWVEAEKIYPCRTLAKVIRKKDDSREFWLWFQNLVTDESRTAEELTKILMSDDDVSKSFGSPATVRIAIITARNKFFNVRLARGRPLGSSSAPPEKQRKVVEAHKEKNSLAQKIEAVLSLELSSPTLTTVLREIISKEH